MNDETALQNKSEEDFDHTKPLFIPEGKDSLTRLQYLQ